jgi:hypothetical protein
MRMRVTLLSLLVIALSLVGRPAVAEGAVTFCDEAGNCGSCCYDGQGCVQWCETHCATDNCSMTPNSMCCGAGGFSIECKREM